MTVARCTDPFADALRIVNEKENAYREAILAGDVVAASRLAADTARTMSDVKRHLRRAKNRTDAAHERRRAANLEASIPQLQADAEALAAEVDECRRECEATVQPKLRKIQGLRDEIATIPRRASDLRRGATEMLWDTSSRLLRQQVQDLRERGWALNAKLTEVSKRATANFPLRDEIEQLHAERDQALADYNALAGEPYSLKAIDLDGPDEQPHEKPPIRGLENAMV